MDSKWIILHLLLIIICLSIILKSQSNSIKTCVIDTDNYTNVGQIGLTVTNYGVLGEGWKNKDQPSCRCKMNTNNIREQVEHFSYAGLWVGGQVGSEYRVTTSIIDGAFDYNSEGCEFQVDPSKGDTIKIKSTLEQNPYYDKTAVSHQDFICDYNDFGIVTSHKPLGIRVHQESYAWSYDQINTFVIMNYTIYNESHLIQSGGWSIKNVYCGIWVDPAVANMNYTSIYESGGGFTWYDNLDGFDKTIFDPYPDDEYTGNPRNIAYQYDVDSDDGYTQSYIGVRFLGNTTVPNKFWESYYRQWVWTISTNADYPEYILPLDDAQRYAFMHTSVPTKIGTTGYNADGYPNATNSWLFLLSAGPFGSEANSDSTEWNLNPGDSIQVAFAIVCAPWANTYFIDDKKRKELLYNYSDLAQKTYNGEDINGNGILDNGEDSNQNGIIDRFKIPPNSPINVCADWKYPVVQITWNSDYQDAIGFNIYKMNSEKHYQKLNDEIITNYLFIDTTAYTIGNNSYFITSINTYNMESIPSNKVSDILEKPVIKFVYDSNPTNYSSSFQKSDTAFTFATRTFHWYYDIEDISDEIDYFSYALDDTNEWQILENTCYQLTLYNISQGSHKFYLKAKSKNGTESEILSYPDTTRYSPKCWFAKKTEGDILLVNNFYTDIYNKEENCVLSELEDYKHSIWMIDDAFNQLPYNNQDVIATLKCFKKVIWIFSYYENNMDDIADLLQKCVNDSISLIINNPVINYLNVPLVRQDSVITGTLRVNPGGRILGGAEILSQKDDVPDLYVKSLIGFRINQLLVRNENDILYKFNEGNYGYSGTPIIAIEKENLSVLTVPISYIGGEISKLFQYLLNGCELGNYNDENDVISGFRLLENYPNPFNAETTIRYNLAKTSNVELAIYNINGQLVDKLIQKKQESGYYTVKWNACNYCSGIYFYQIKAGGFKQVRKMLLVK